MLVQVSTVHPMVKPGSIEEMILEHDRLCLIWEDLSPVECARKRELAGEIEAYYRDRSK